MKYLLLFIFLINIIKQSTSNKSIPYLIKYLYPDSLNETFDFTSIIFNTKNDLNQTIYLDENLPLDSFISYIVLKSTNHLTLNLFGKHREKFQLSKIDFGSTSFIDSTIYPVINLYSLKLIGNLDREELTTINLTLRTNVSTQPSFLTIQVQDINDNEPKFLSLNQTFNLYENNKKNVCLGRVRAVDLDAGENGTINYFYVNGSLIDVKNNQVLNDSIFYSNFLIDSKTGDICVTSSLDRELYEGFNFKIKARDCAKMSLVSKQEFTASLIINDLNDNAPQFYTQESEFYLNENSESKTFIAWFKAFDLDAGNNSKIDYYIQKIDDLDPPVYIDEFGILKNLYQIQIGNKTVRQESIFYLNRNYFDLKIIARDRGKIIQNSNEKKIRIYVVKNDLIYFDLNFMEIKSNFSYDLNLNNSDLGKFDMYPSMSSSTKGLNCQIENILDNFKLFQNGSLKISNFLPNETICFINIRKLCSNRTYLYHYGFYSGLNETQLEIYKMFKTTSKSRLINKLENQSNFMIFYFVLIGTLLVGLVLILFLMVYTSKLKLIKFFLSKNLSEPVNSLISYKPEVNNNNSNNCKLIRSIDSNKQLIDLRKEIDLCNKKLSDFNGSSSTNSSLLIKDSPRGSDVTTIEDSNQEKKVSYGIYQVANQIIIDYDDNTSCEVICNKSSLNSSLKRFESLYYTDNLEEKNSSDQDDVKNKCLSSFV
ncbi:unnamed protein product [Brachionus calyciflorus]|uniref:Cadherin domain-containing protein n=1 Tax=Brachionus calyciflorus TaxID=104777 RepID=A0A813ZXR7_9BILA|nr:unnamed protein product [Brachionus calyciflorus]